MKMAHTGIRQRQQSGQNAADLNVQPHLIEKAIAFLDFNKNNPEIQAANYTPLIHLLDILNHEYPVENEDDYGIEIEIEDSDSDSEADDDDYYF